MEEDPLFLEDGDMDAARSVPRNPPTVLPGVDAGTPDPCPDPLRFLRGKFSLDDGLEASFLAGRVHTVERDETERGSASRAGKEPEHALRSRPTESVDRPHEEHSPGFLRSNHRFGERRVHPVGVGRLHLLEASDHLPPLPVSSLLQSLQLLPDGTSVPILGALPGVDDCEGWRTAIGKCSLPSSRFMSGCKIVR